MKLWAPIEELRASVNLAPGLPSDRDEDLFAFANSAQNFATRYCKRGFDGNAAGPAEYFSGQIGLDKLVAKNFPIQSITSINDDVYRGYNSDSLLSSSDYSFVPETGMVYLKNGLRFSEGNQNIKLIYRGGYISETVVVAQALAANGMTIADALSTYGQPFSLFLKVKTAKNAGNVTIIGTDEGGVSQTETLSVAGVSKLPLRLISRRLWKSVTTFNALPIQGDASTGTIEVTATSFPEDLRAAICLHVAHLFFQDQNQTVNSASRSQENQTESGMKAEVPKEVIQLLNSYRNYL